MNEISKAMKLITLGTYVIGVKTDEKENLMTAAWLTQISSKPATLLVAIGKTHYTADLIEKSGCFSVSILTGKQYDTAKRCGFVSGRNTDKLSGEKVTYSKAGLPLIDDAAAHMDCEVIEKFEIDDHMLFAGKVLNASVYSEDTMTYRQDDFFE